MANAINDLVKSNLPSRVKIGEPDPFDGLDPKKLCTFLLQCKLNFQDCKDLFQDETTNINYVLSYLKGSALDCFKPGLLDPVMTRSMLSPEPVPAPAQPRSPGPTPDVSSQTRPHHVTSCDPLPSCASADACECIMVCMAPSGLCSFLTCPIVHRVV